MENIWRGKQFLIMKPSVLELEKYVFTLSQAFRICENINELTGLYVNLMDVKTQTYYWRPYLFNCSLKDVSCMTEDWLGEIWNTCSRGLNFLTIPIRIKKRGMYLLLVGPFIIAGICHEHVQVSATGR